MRDLHERFPIYSRLLYLYPATYRRHYGEQILQTTADMLDNAPGPAERHKIWFRLVLDVPFNLGRQQVTYLGEIMSKDQKVDAGMWFRPKRFGLVVRGYRPNSWEGWTTTLIILAAGFSALFAARHYRPQWFTRNPLRLGHGPFSLMPKAWQAWVISIVFVLVLVVTIGGITWHQKRAK